MRHINKNPEPQSFIDWKLANNTILQEKYQTESGDGIWKWFTDTLDFVEIKAELRHALLMEQGFICCYCGRGINKNVSAIDGNIPVAIEHFSLKSIYKNLIFEYSNLMVSCKCSHLPRPKSLPVAIKFKETLGFENLETLEQISGKTECSVWYLRKLNPILSQIRPRNPITQINIGGNIFLYFRHCDDRKDEFDINNVENLILDPTQTADCASKFKYKPDGYIEMTDVAETVKINILDRVLNLNAYNLCEMRSQIYVAAENERKNLEEQLEKEEITDDELEYLINSQDFPNPGTGFRSEFCFIFTYLLKKLLPKAI